MKMRMKTKMRKRRSSRRQVLFSFVPVLAVPIGRLAAGSKKKAPEPYGVVGGTVFRDPGFALPGAEVTLTPELASGQDGPSIKKLTAISDARGEFVFRVPTAPMRYTVRVTLKGYSSQQKTVASEGEQRVDATFTLQPESK
jgi:Carboxypeptidase regulatory-like domain